MARLLVYLCGVSLPLLFSTFAEAQSGQWRLCRKPKDGSIVAVPITSLCDRRRTDITGSFIGPQGASGPVGPAGEAGPQGIAGPQGEPGVGGDPYGDGSGGDILPTFPDTFLNGNVSHQFRNFTVPSGITLEIPSGTVIRCTGDVTIAGTLRVRSFCKGGFVSMSGPVAGGSCIQVRLPGSGATAASATSDLDGEGGAALSFYSVKNILHPGPFGGGGGASSTNIPSENDGGGTVTIIAKGVITNSGLIAADGVGGSTTNSLLGQGGGGGGIIILASKEEIVNTGTISVRGGDGNASRDFSGRSIFPGGGGGGGIIRLISPSVTSSGALDVRQGNGGTVFFPLAQTTWVGGGGGGASGGDGGRGGLQGSPGIALQVIADPTSLF